MNAVTCLTIAQMLLHSILGCCWHHRHSSDVMVAAGPANAGHHSATTEVRDCTHHHHDTAKRPDKAKKHETPDLHEGHSSSPDPCQHQQHKPCDTDRCTLDAAATVRAPQLLTHFDFAALAILVPPTAGLLPTSTVSCGSHTANAADLQLRAMRLRAVRQVWLI